MYREICRELIEFIHSSPSAYHVVDNVKSRLTEQGYIELFEEEVWNIREGGKYFVIRNMTSLIAFRLPENTDGLSFRAALTHSDSPSLKIKNSVSEKGSPSRLSVELYGGLIQESFLDRPLAVAGRVTVAEEERVESRLVNLDSACLIPRTPPHLMKEQKLNPALDLVPLYSSGEKNLFDKIASCAGVRTQDILSCDLYAVPCEKGFVWGEEEEFISSPRLDNLQSLHAALSGFLNCCDETSAPLLALFDNEETGSLSVNGADSTFLSDTLRRVCEKLGLDFEGYLRVLTGSYFASVDVAHALHPNHPELFDKSNAPVLNGGVAIKYNASGRYTSDSVSSGLFQEIARIAGVPVQAYHNRSDIQGGSTLGRLSLSHLSVLTLDIGAPILAMHSALETAGARDTEYLARVLEMFYSVSIEKKNNTYTVN